MALSKFVPTSRSLIRTGASGFVLLSCLLLPLLGCDEGSQALVPSLGSIEITTMTDGDGPAPNSFTVLLNGAVSGTTGPNDVYTMTSMPHGNYVVGLEEKPDRCRFLTNNREVTVEVNQTTAVTFLVLCDVAGPEDPETR